VFVAFIQRLLAEGSVVLASQPVIREEERESAAELLSSAFSDAALDVAGPPLSFDAPTALGAAECLGAACWFLLSRAERSDVVARTLTLPGPGDSPEKHFSADVVLRFLPAVHRRARALSPDDVLTRSLEKILREWPLTGALADASALSLPPPTFGGHHGLLLLYAERLVRQMKSARALDGPAAQYVELVLAERGMPLLAPASGR
jgi:hypothetical protein